jgi:hypothetical protein
LSTASSGDDFGFSLAISGDELMVRACNDFDGALMAAGSAYLYLDTTSIEVPALSAGPKGVLVALIAASVVAGIYRSRREEMSP